MPNIPLPTSNLTRAGALSEQRKATKDFARMFAHWKTSISAKAPAVRRKQIILARKSGTDLVDRLRNDGLI